MLHIKFERIKEKTSDHELLTKGQCNCFITGAEDIFMDKTHQFSLIWRKKKDKKIMKHKEKMTRPLHKGF